MKECSKCGRVWPLSEYLFRSVERGTYRHVCRECRKAYHDAYYQDNSDRYKAHRRKNQRRYRAENRARMLEYLSDKECIDCGESDPVVLELDHVRGTKDFDVARMLSGNGWDRILQELAKCDVRCANCHRRKTARDFKWFKGNFGA